MSLSATRIRAVIRKEFREYRRNRFIIYTMATLPLFFIALPVIELFNISASSGASIVRTQVDVTMLLMLVIPVVLPATIAAYSVIGGTRPGHARAAPHHSRQPRGVSSWASRSPRPFPRSAWPTCSFSRWCWPVRFASPRVVVHAVWQPSWFVAEVLFAPLLAAWSVWGRHRHLGAVVRRARRATVGHLGQSSRAGPATSDGAAGLPADRHDRHRARPLARRH